MNKFIKEKQEIIMYLVFGVATTGVNWAVYSLLVKASGVDLTISNLIAWIASVLFAYVTNKIWVFNSHTHSIKEIAKELTSFVGCRAISGVVEIFGLPLLVSLGLNQTLFGIKGLYAKLILSVFVIIANYVFSKLFIFKEKEV